MNSKSTTLPQQAAVTVHIILSKTLHMQRNHELQSTQIIIIMSTSMPADHPSCTSFPLPQPQNPTSNLLSKVHSVQHFFHKCNYNTICEKY